MLLVLFLLGILTGATAAIVGFGIGSFLTPILALRTSFGAAVAAVGMAHFAGSILRFWLFKADINRKVLLTFGLFSAVGGLFGALLQGWSSSAALAVVFGGLMVLAGISNLFGISEKLNVRGPLAWIVGGLAGFFGGLVGNQGGLRATGLMGFRLKKAEFVATTSAVALLVDVLRVPIYVATRSTELRRLMTEIVVMSVGVVIGTLLGAPVLRHLPERAFRVVMSIIIIIVGVLVAVRL